jgi:hypothetical protein
MNLRDEQLKAITRRHFFQCCGGGIGTLALTSLLNPALLRAGDPGSAVSSAGPDPGDDPMRPRAPHFPAKAKRVIYLHMAGAPSQLDLFDHKPALDEWNGKPAPDELTKGERFAFIKGTPQVPGLAIQVCPLRSERRGAF